MSISDFLIFIFVLLALFSILLMAFSALLLPNFKSALFTLLLKPLGWKFSRKIITRIKLNSEVIGAFFLLFVAALTLAFVAAFVQETWENYGTSIIGIFLFGLGWLWKIGRWIILIAAIGYVLHSLKEALVEEISDRVADKISHKLNVTREWE